MHFAQPIVTCSTAARRMCISTSRWCCCLTLQWHRSRVLPPADGALLHAVPEVGCAAGSHLVRHKLVTAVRLVAIICCTWAPDLCATACCMVSAHDMLSICQKSSAIITLGNSRAGCLLSLQAIHAALLSAVLSRERRSVVQRDEVWHQRQHAGCTATLHQRHT